MIPCEHAKKVTVPCWARQSLSQDGGDDEEGRETAATQQSKLLLRTRTIIRIMNTLEVTRSFVSSAGIGPAGRIGVVRSFGTLLMGPCSRAALFLSRPLCLDNQSSSFWATDLVSGTDQSSAGRITRGTCGAGSTAAKAAHTLGEYR